MRTGDKPPGRQNVLLGRAITDYVPFFFVFCFLFLFFHQSFVDTNYFYHQKSSDLCVLKSYHIFT